jgi:hypothetical protein
VTTLSEQQEKNRKQKEKQEEEGFWEKYKQKNTREFEETRRCLLNSYNSNIQTHAGYIIVIIIGLLGLISSSRALISAVGVIITLILFVIFIAPLSIYMICRIFFWTYYANSAIALTLDDAIELYKNHYQKVDLKMKEPSIMAILNVAIWQKLVDDDKIKRRQVFLKLARWLANHL